MPIAAAMHQKTSLKVTLGLCATLLCIAFPERMAQAANGSVVYTYDALGRIATANYDTGVFIIYSYDSNGNRLSQTVNVNTTTLIWGSGVWGQALW